LYVSITVRKKTKNTHKLEERVERDSDNVIITDTMINRSTGGNVSRRLDRVMYFGIYSKSCVCECGHPLDGCVDGLRPGKIPEFVTLVLLLLPATLSLMFRAASLGVFEIRYHSDPPFPPAPLEDTGDGEQREA
jgi:hypothetical protein